MPDTRVRRQRAELDDVFVLDEAGVGVMAARGLEDDLNGGLGNFDFEMRLGWMLGHVEIRRHPCRQAFPVQSRLVQSRLETMPMTLSSPMAPRLSRLLEKFQSKNAARKTLKDLNGPTRRVHHRDESD